MTNVLSGAQDSTMNCLLNGKFCRPDQTESGLGLHCLLRHIITYMYQNVPSIGTPNIINFPFIPNGKLII